MAVKNGTPTQTDEIRTLFADKNNMDEEEIVRRVMKLYDNMNLKQSVETAIADEFETAQRHLDSIVADETLKTPLREMLETLNGRKK